MSDTALASLVDQFLEYLEIERNVSPLTIRNYGHYLRRFGAWLAKVKFGSNLSDINAENMRQYRVFLSRFESHGSPLSRKTQSYHIIALRAFLKYLRKNDYDTLAPEKLDLPKADASSPSFLSGEQVERLLTAPTLSTPQGKRDKALLELLFSTGLRVSELVSLDRDKLDVNSREFGIIGKGRRPRVVFVSRRAASFIEEYLKIRDDHYKPLFIRFAGKKDPGVSDESMRLTPRSIQRMIKKYAKKIKLPVEVTPHVMRHSFATDLLMAGADIRSVQEMLGHKNISTTQIYTHVTNKQLREVHEAFHGRSK
ncbi:tyrosine-type recombinase/integrase [Candidatus Microgenomates bacterium]|nr:tyrosine-type recombinase/integrase [Candidatus Microgenomates bacterium]